MRKTNDEDIRIEPAEAGPGKPRDAKPWSGPKGKGGPKRDAHPPAQKGERDGKPFKDRKGPKDKKRAPNKHP